MQYLFIPDSLKDTNPFDSNVAVVRSLIYILLNSLINHPNEVIEIRRMILTPLLISLNIPSVSMDQNDPIILLHMGLSDTISYLISKDINIEYFNQKTEKIVEIKDIEKDRKLAKPDKSNNIIYLLLYLLNTKKSIKECISEIIKFYNPSMSCSICSFDYSLLLNEFSDESDSSSSPLFERTMNTIILTCLKYREELSSFYWTFVISRFEYDGFNKIYAFQMLLNLIIRNKSIPESYKGDISKVIYNEIKDESEIVILLSLRLLITVISLDSSIFSDNIIYFRSIKQYLLYIILFL